MLCVCVCVYVYGRLVGWEDSSRFLSRTVESIFQGKDLNRRPTRTLPNVAHISINAIEKANNHQKINYMDTRSAFGMVVDVEASFAEMATSAKILRPTGSDLANPPTTTYNPNSEDRQQRKVKKRPLQSNDHVMGTCISPDSESPLLTTSTTI